MNKWGFRLCIALLLLNLWFWAWSGGHLRRLGFGPTDPREPQRLENQVRPEALQLLPNPKKP
jgi:hypothetical protein